MFGGRVGFWSACPGKDFTAHLLLRSGRAVGLVTLYDSAFGSPEAMTARHPMGPQWIVADSPAVTTPLREVGRGREADRLLGIGDRTIRAAMARGRVPRDIYETAARTWALQGKRTPALRALEQAVAMGWQYDQFGLVPRLAEDPVYRSLWNSLG